MTGVAPFTGDGSVWDAFVNETPRSSFCHLAAWRDVMEDVLGHQSVYLVARAADGRWCGVLPLVRVRSRIFGDFLVSLPFLNYGGPVGEPSAARLLEAEAVALARRFGVDLLELRSRHPSAGELRVSTRRLTVVLGLPESAEQLWAGFGSKLRAQIRRAEREGFTIRFGLDQLDPFYEVFARHMHELGTPVLPRAWFERIAACCGALFTVGVVYRDRQPVAAGAGFLWRDEFEITWASDLRAFRRAAPNMLLYWEFLRQATARGARTFNFGRCSPNGGTHRFKRQWGGTDVALHWGQWSPRAVTATPTPERPVYRLAAAAWRRIPLPLANTLGPALARRIP
jgi:FemAB-related protein (PEP-CTERM system-associated)